MLLRVFTLTFSSLLLAPLTFAQTCENYGSSSDGTCRCPPGLNPTGMNPQSCHLPVCGGDLYNRAGAAPGGTNGLGNVTQGSCGCTSGWAGPGCTGTSTFTFMSTCTFKPFHYASHHDVTQADGQFVHRPPHALPPSHHSPPHPASTPP